MVLKVKDLIGQGFTVQEIVEMAEKEINREVEAEQKKRASDLQLRRNVLKSFMTYLIAIGKVDPQDIKPGKIDELNTSTTDEDMVRAAGCLGLLKTKEIKIKNTDSDTAAIDNFLKNLFN